jgi:transposase
MPKRLKVRTVTKEEQEELKRLLNARNAPVKLVQRASVIQRLLEEPNLGAAKAGRQAGYKNDASGAYWVNRFNEAGLAGLADKPRPGRPPVHAEEVRSKLIDLVLQKPRSLGYPFELWTLVRLQEAFEEREGVHLSDSTIWTWLQDEGLDWKRQQSWFHEAESHDPAFVEKRGQ